MRVATWGNRLAVRLPAAAVVARNDGDDIEIYLAFARASAVARKSGCKELRKRLRTCRGRLLADFTFVRDEAIAR